jgi:4Fe-4S single cluster domain
MTTTETPGTVILAERFVSVQGDGPLTGQRCAFVPFSRCNLACARCDTPESWDWTRFDPSATARVAADDLAGWVGGSGVDLLVVTGGEPLMQDPPEGRLARRRPGHSQPQPYRDRQIIGPARRSRHRSGPRPTPRTPPPRTR